MLLQALDDALDPRENFFPAFDVLLCSDLQSFLPGQAPKCQLAVLLNALPELLSVLSRFVNAGAGLLQNLALFVAKLQGLLQLFSKSDPDSQRQCEDNQKESYSYNYHRRRNWHGISASNDEVERPHTRSDRATRAHTFLLRPRSFLSRLSRSAPTIVRTLPTYELPYTHGVARSSWTDIRRPERGTTLRRRSRCAA